MSRAPAATVLRWPYPPQSTPVDLSRVLGLLSPLGLTDRDSVATQVLHLLSERVPLAQCTLFAFDGERAPITMGVGDRARTRELPQIAQAYTQRYWRHDPVLAAMREFEREAARCTPERALVVLQRQTPAALNHDAYRQTCYERPQVAERVAILSHHGAQRWISVNLYRGLEHGPLSAQQWDTVQAFAPVIVQAVRLHHASRWVHADLMPLMLERLRTRHPALTERDVDVVRALLDGLDQTALALRLGLSANSAPTYTKRLYRKLGVNGRSQLTAHLLASV